MGLFALSSLTPLSHDVRDFFVVPKLSYARHALFAFFLLIYFTDLPFFLSLFLYFRDVAQRIWPLPHPLFTGELFLPKSIIKYRDSSVLRVITGSHPLPGFTDIGNHKRRFYFPFVLLLSGFEGMCFFT